MDRRIVKRSSWASGSGYVPSYSIGFCVAMTMKGRASSYVVPSIVTWFSCMHSSSADCVFGEARLISSTSRRFANTGPGRNSNSFVGWLKTLTPVTSDGSRSGVNWMRENDASSERARALASIVFPTPGKSSMIRWPSLSRQRTQRRSFSAGAWTTRARFSATACPVWAAASTSGFRSAASSITLLEEPRDLVEHRRRNRGLGCLVDPALPRPRDQDDLVVRRVEADVVPADVVEDDEVGRLRLQHRALPLQTGVAVIRAEGDKYLTVLATMAERCEHVVRWYELEAPRVLVLRPLGRLRIRRPVIGHRRGHEDGVGVGTGGGLPQHVRRGRRVDDVDACRRRDAEVRSEQRHVRPAATRLRRERDPHPAGRAVTDESHRVERLARPAGADEESPTRERARPEQL